MNSLLHLSSWMPSGKSMLSCSATLGRGLPNKEMGPSEGWGSEDGPRSNLRGDKRGPRSRVGLCPGLEDGVEGFG